MTPQESRERSTPAPQSVRRLSERLRAHIADGVWRPGDKIPTIQQLARDEGVSAYQAREAVLRLVRAGLLWTRRGAGTFVAEQADTQRPTEPEPAPDPPADEGRARQRVLFVGTRAGDDQFERLATALNRRFQGEAIDLEPIDVTHEPLRDALERLRTQGAPPPAGIVVRGPQFRAQEMVRRVYGEAPIVIQTMIDAAAARGDHQVNPDYDAVRAIAAERLLAAGHRRIGIVTHRRPGPLRAGDPQTSAACGRNHGLARFGRLVRGELGRGALTIHRQRGSGARRVEDLVAWLSRPDRPTAVYGADFRIAMAIRAAERLGLRVPDDLEVLGEGNTMWAEEFDFPSIDLRLSDIASHIAALLRRDPAEMRRARTQTRVQPVLVERPAPADPEGRAPLEQPATAPDRNARSSS